MAEQLRGRASSPEPVAPKPEVYGAQGALVMEVDRVSRMGGVRPEGVPAWPQRDSRRRKFSEEVPESEAEADERESAGEIADPAEVRGTLDVLA